jgi:pilus assembly protein Flp/PilA
MEARSFDSEAVARRPAAAGRARLRGRLRGRDERGQGLVEYALIIALVSLASVVALGFLSGKINDIFFKSGNVLNSVDVVAAPGGTGGTGNGTGGALVAPSYVSGGSLWGCGAPSPTLGGCSDGETINVSAGVFDGNPAPDVTYQWYTNNTENASCISGFGWSAVGGETGQSYGLPGSGPGSNEVGVRITATNSEGSVTRDQCTRWG